MAQDWSLDSPTVIDIGGVGEHVDALEIGIVAGNVDVITHTDSPTARLEVHDITGTPLQVSWDGRRLRIVHGPTSSSLLDLFVAKIKAFEGNRVRLSVSVPEDTTVSVTTVSAGALVSGVRADTAVRTVSGSLTLDDLRGAVDVNTVSGEVEVRTIAGELKVITVSGSVTAQGCDLAKVGINTVSGDITLDLTNAVAAIRSTSVSGDVTVRAPYAGYSVSATTAGGQIVADGRELPKNARAGMGGEATSGDGGLVVRANAVSGSIVLLHRDQAAPVQHVGQER